MVYAGGQLMYQLKIKKKNAVYKYPYLNYCGFDDWSNYDGAPKYNFAKDEKLTGIYFRHVYNGFSRAKTTTKTKAIIGMIIELNNNKTVCFDSQEKLNWVQSYYYLHSFRSLNINMVDRET